MRDEADAQRLEVEARTEHVRRLNEENERLRLLAEISHLRCCNNDVSSTKTQVISAAQLISGSMQRESDRGTSKGV